jgi:hypothetical protein
MEFPRVKISNTKLVSLFLFPSNILFRYIIEELLHIRKGRSACGVKIYYWTGEQNLAFSQKLYI